MSRFRGWMVRARRVLAGRRFDDEMAEEMRAHIELEAAEHRAAGADPETARHRARAAFDHVDGFKERVRDRRMGRFIEELVRDLSYGARWLRRNPGLALAATLTLGFGVGLSSIGFALAWAMLFKPVPFPTARGS